MTRDDLDWYRPDGIPMSPRDWNAPFARAVMIALSGASGDSTRPDDPVTLTGRSLLLLRSPSAHGGG